MKICELKCETKKISKMFDTIIAQKIGANISERIAQVYQDHELVGLLLRWMVPRSIGWLVGESVS